MAPNASKDKENREPSLLDIMNALTGVNKQVAEIATTQKDQGVRLASLEDGRKNDKHKEEKLRQEREKQEKERALIRLLYLVPKWAWGLEQTMRLARIVK